MTKTISILLLLSAFSMSYGQHEAFQMPVDQTSGLITYQEVVNVNGTKDELFNRCATWLHSFYANPWEVAKIRDQATGLIKIQHQFRVYDLDENGLKTDAGMIIYNMKIEFKENKYRYTIDNLLLKAVSRYPIENWLDNNRPDYSEKCQNYLQQIDAYFRDELIKSLKEGMLPPQEVKPDEW